MTEYVLDASITLCWCFNDEATPATWRLLGMLEEGSAVVPAIWTLEITNILINAERRGRLTEAKVHEFIHLLQGLNIEIDQETPSRAFREILLLSRAHNLSSYDAAYLELARRLGIPLATKDQVLRKVARELGMTVLPK
jgi:predicted nucleic acid-binding protein